MSTVRAAPIPTDFVESELAAFPLASEAALASGLTRLDPGLRDATGRLWRAAEEAVAGRCAGYALDELVAIRDRIWFEANSGRQAMDMRTYLRRLARDHLVREGAVARPRFAADGGNGAALSVSDEVRARQRWRWMSFALPPDLLLGALDRGNDMPREVELVAPPLANSLRDLGFAEIHLHLGAAPRFPDFWATTMAGLTLAQAGESAFHGPEAPFDQGRYLAAWLLRAALARIVLAWFLLRRRPSERLEDFLARRIRPRLSSAAGATSVAVFDRALQETERGRLAARPVPFATLGAIYARLATLASGRRRIRFRDPLAWRLDPIAPLLPAAPQGATADGVFTRLALNYLAVDVDPADHRFDRLFWSAVRVQGIYYRHLVQRPLTPGLAWFVRHYDRLRAARGPLMGISERLRAAAQSSGAGRGLASLEVRDAPDAAWSKTRKTIRTLKAQAPELGVPEVGVVFHFARDRGGGFREGRPGAHGQGSEADPRRGTGQRYGGFYTEQRKRAQALVSLLRFWPGALKWVRGLDLCTDELGVPLWVMTPLFAMVRREAERATRRLAAPVPTLRTTVHAGEDFVHLMGGLRRIWDVDRYLRLSQGDRLGHALALGTDPDQWAARVGRVPISREERLLDLVWEWSCYESGEVVCPVGRAPFVDGQIAILSERIFGLAQPPRALDRLIRDLHDPWFLTGEVGFPNHWRMFARPTVIQPDTSRLDLALFYLGSAAVFEYGREVVWIDPRQDVDALRALQGALRRRLKSKNIYVEVNPSSNLLIGNLGDLEQHPLWDLAPLSPDGRSDRPTMSLCIGSDDPITFATTLPEEYQYLRDVIVLSGQWGVDAEGWLDRVRRNGLDARFTVSGSGA